VPQVLIRDLDVAVLDKLKARAQRHGRSLQAELKIILQQAAAMNAAEARLVAQRIRGRLANRSHSDSAGLLAEDRLR
jgi:plasmid stability protein